MKHVYKIISSVLIVTFFLVPAVSAKAAPPPIAKPIIAPGMSQEEIDVANSKYEKELAERKKEEAERRILERKIEKSFLAVKKAAKKYYTFDGKGTEPDTLGFHFYISLLRNPKTRVVSPIWVDATANDKGEVRYRVGKKSYSERSFIKALKAKKF